MRSLGVIYLNLDFIAHGKNERKKRENKKASKKPESKWQKPDLYNIEGE